MTIAPYTPVYTWLKFTTGNKEKRKNKWYSGYIVAARGGSAAVHSAIEQIEEIK